ncbi:efflux RND transporter permease subunit [Pseudovibrio exalbescens]|uniref:efflux RND transporter permease subunit n=1 Tax=Pseudovibrio exalbescens TaxID=197461 RepID=UPI00041D3440|nr:efflux RND transporter permease subunit [Pseudovibrio exalbescens]
MTALTNWFLRNPVAANLLMVFLLVVGLTSLLTMRIEGFPKIPADTVVITTTLPNAYTEQVDKQITRQLERAVEGLQGVKNIRSVSQPGYSIIRIQQVDGYDLQKLLDDVRLKVDGVHDLPKDARRPVIQTNNFDVPALYVSIHGDTDLKTLQSLARSLRQQLLAGIEISRVNDWGLQGQEIAIEMTPGALERLDLTISDVMTKIQESSLYFQGGTLRREGGYISLRADSQAYTVEDYRQIPLVEWPDGSTTYLGDVASITDGFEEVDFQTRFNGLQSVGMEVLIGRKDNLLDVSAEAGQIIADFNRTLPEGVTAEIWGNSSHYISDRLQLLSSSAVQGLLLVALLLAIFLNVKLAFWVAMGIPISMAGALAVSTTSWIDYSLNDITTFGFIIVLGILVDDAVVVGESVHEQRRRYPDPIKGTEVGVQRVSVATVFGVLTTVAAFAPMLLIENPFGKVLASFAGVVILALLFSLVESKLILPAHLAHISIHNEARKTILARLWSYVQAFFRAGLFGFRDRVYAPALRVALANRYAVLILFVAIGTLVFGLMATGQIKSTFFPNVPGQILSVSMEMDPRAPVQLTRTNVGRLETAALELNEEFAGEMASGQPPIEHLSTYMSGAGKADLYLELIPADQRPEVTTRDVMEAWRARVGGLEGISELSFSGFEEFGGGFEIQLLGEDAQMLRAASSEVREKLAGFEGVTNVRDTFNSGQPELRLRLKPEARHLGFSSERLASQIGYAFGGGEAQRIQRGTSEVRVVVRSAFEARNTIEDLLQLRLKSSDGAWIPLEAIADVEARYINNEITLHNAQQVSLVSADVNRDVVAPEELGKALFGAFAQEIESKYPGISIKRGGELEDIGELQGGLLRAFIIAALLIYILIAVPLKSYWKPFLIMSVVPFGFVGAVIGHGIMDLPFSLLSFFGVLALIGVVVNDSLVMMTFYLQSREEGMSHDEATYRCGVDRFQAIFLTTATTVVGLIPLMSETSEQALYLVPAAVSLAFGEIFATLITLILIPVLLSISEDVRQLVWGRNKKTDPVREGVFAHSNHATDESSEPVLEESL